ncbi:FG-GAP-like repeat-containing protein [Dactylosporangium sp. NPDC049525]|uniref:FG-GAP-like repeat-containing protein n=1 Tax=Dactylosporangium sp. NPDC049525 TaxID=3154730 RepID=UPI00343B3564
MTVFAAAGLLAGALFVVLPAHAAPVVPSDPDVPVQKSASVSTQTVRPRTVSQTDTGAAWAPRPVTWPAAGSSEVDISVPAAGARARAGSSPVWAGRSAQAKTTAGPSRLKVEVFDRAAATAVGVSGVLLRMSWADDAYAVGSASVEVDYSAFRDAYGGDWSARLTLLQLPECALSTPQLEVCQQGTAVATRNDKVGTRLTADVSVGAQVASKADLAEASRSGSLVASAPTVLAVTALASSADGPDYSHTPLSAAGSWQAGTQSGEFSWNYPLAAPPGLGGPVPQVALGYSSSQVDGRTNASGAQTSWIGEGWGYEAGYIERSFRSCADDYNNRIDVTSGWSGYGRVLPVMDYDGDGKVDVVGINGSNDMMLWRNTSHPGSASVGTAQNLGPGWQIADVVMAGDFDGDGKTDVVGRVGNQLNVYRGQGSGAGYSLAPSVVLPTSGWSGWTGWSAYSKFLPMADYDNDGKVDILAVRGTTMSSPGGLDFFRNTSTAGSPSATWTQTGGVWGSVNTFLEGDYNGDGKRDILGRSGDAMYVWPGNGTVGTFSVGASTIWSTGWSGYGAFLPLKDYDADGKPDIMAVVGTDMYFYRNTSTGGAVTVDARLFSSSVWGSVNLLVAGDFDTDGKVDVIGREGDALRAWLNVGKPGEPIYAPFFTNATSDSCWRSQNATVVFGGRSGELVLDDATSTWRLASDDGSKFELLTSTTNNNGDNNGEHWKLTATDGTKYYFGLNQIPGWVAGNPETNSALRIPVFANRGDEPCFQVGGFAASWCYQTWRWNLDYVEDPHGNTMSYWYTKEGNATGLFGNPNATAAYDRGVVLNRMDYGTRKNASLSTPAPMQMVFTTGDRCLASCWSGSNPVTANWPDTPWDLKCAGPPCNNNVSPTFWTSKRLASVTTKVWGGTSYRDVDEWTFTHQFPPTGDGTSPSLWLASITRTGKVGGVKALPAVTFGGTAYANRTDFNVGAGVPQTYKYRVTRVSNGTGGELGITYNATNCSISSLPDPDNNTQRCFPQYYTPPAAQPGWSWWNKYTVSQVLEKDLVGGNPDVVHGYDYSTANSSTAVLWHHNDSAWSTKISYRSWSSWRGYSTVKVTTGASGEPQSYTEYLYMRGMDKDRTDAGLYTRTATVTATEGPALADDDRLAGFLRETRKYDGPGTTLLSATLNDPWQQQTASRTLTPAWAAPNVQTAGYVRTARSQTRTWIAATSTWRRTDSQTTYDTTYAQPTTVKDLGDTTTASDDRCSSITYARNTTDWLIDYPAQTLITDCTASPAPANHLGGSQTLYDDNAAVGSIGTRGLNTKSTALDSFTGSTPVWRQTAHAIYDANGRIQDTFDAADNKTMTRFTTAAGGTVTSVTTTNPLGHASTVTLDGNRNTPVSTTDANLKTTNVRFDPLGRLTHVWAAGRATNLSPNIEYVYNIHDYNNVADQKPSSVLTKKLGPNNNIISTYEFSDGLLRARQTQASAPAANGGRIIADTKFDSRGFVSKSSIVYNNASGPVDTLVSFGDHEVLNQHRYTYDTLGRKTADALYAAGVSTPTFKWQTSTSYDGDRVTTTPPTGGAATITFSNARGLTTELRQYLSGTATGSYQATTYTYDPLDRLTQVQDQSNNVWATRYNLRGWADQSIDPDRGTTNVVSFDLMGQPVTTTDARNVSITRVYDALGRVTDLYDGVDTTGTKRASWLYDTIAKGQVTSASRFVGSDTFKTTVTGYNDGYQALGTTTSIPSSLAMPWLPADDYTTSMTFNVDGSQATLTYPAAGGLMAETVTTTYDNTGNPLTMSGQDTYIAGRSFYNFGAMYQQILGSGAKRVRQTTAIDEATGRLTNAKTETENAANPNTWVERLTEGYGYDPAGNVKNITETLGGSVVVNQCFNYNILRELTEAWTTAASICQATPSTAVVGGTDPYWTSYKYDTGLSTYNNGNRTQEVRHAIGAGVDTTRTYTYPTSDKRHTLTSVTATGGTTGTDSYTYDLKGNMKTRSVVGQPSQTLNWDNEDHLASVVDSAGTTSYIYDANGARLVAKDPAGATVYLPGFEVRKVGSTVTATRYYGVASRTPSGLTWLAADHHGTGQLAVDAVSQAVTRRKTDPFGNPRGVDPSWPNPRGFVGGTRDNTGLTHLGAREYEPAVGRFISDDAITNFGDPQQSNGYSYANNNPTGMSDPTGLLRDMDGGEEFIPEPVTQCVKTTCRSDGATRCHYQSASCRGGTPPPGGWIDVHVKKNGTTTVTYNGRSYINAVDVTNFVTAPNGMSLEDMAAGADRFLDKHTLKVPYEDVDATGYVITQAAADGYYGTLDPAFLIALQSLEPIRESALVGSGGKLMTGDLSDVANFAGGSKTPIMCNSFAPGTLVLMADGSSKPIEEVTEGDVVLASDPSTGLTLSEKVTATIVGEGSKVLVDLTVDTDGESGQAVAHIIVTDQHPIWVPAARRWMAPVDLRAGDTVQTATGQSLHLAAVRVWSQVQRVHNISVATLHTYYVMAGTAPVLVHNAGGPWCNTRKPIFGDRPDYGQTSLYAIFSKDGKLLKWGVSQDPIGRYTYREYADFGKGSYMQVVRNYDDSSDAFANEAYMVKRWPGAWNREAYAGSVAPGGATVTDAIRLIGAGRVLQ